MRAGRLALFLFLSGFFWSAEAHAAILDAELDDTAFSTRPPGSSLLCTAAGCTSATSVYTALGYTPTQPMNVSGLRLRVNNSGSEYYECPQTGAVYKYVGTSTPPDAFDTGVSIGTFSIVSTTTPDAAGNCDYKVRDIHGQQPVALSPQYYHVFFIADYPVPPWVSLRGKPFASSTPISRFGFRPVTYNLYEWGTTGLDVAYFELFDTDPPTHEPLPIPPPDPCAAPGACASNVLFLPGIEGSRLYEGVGCGAAAEEKLWEPIGESFLRILRGAGNDKVRKLYLDTSGKSLCSDIYAKEGDIIGSAGSSDIYEGFIDKMNGLESDGVINDWKSIAYDWRLSLPDLLAGGTLRDEKVYWGEATSSPYILQTLRSLASSSKTGKVTIIAHSNGGLIAKALIQQMGESGAALLVDKIIFVGVPQSGAPIAIGALLHGYDQGISSYGIPILHSSVAQKMAENAPMAYHLLPSEAYLANTVGEEGHPVVRFSGPAYAAEVESYGASIRTSADLHAFLLASTTLNAALVEYANIQHNSLDTWIPPPHITLTQIAGWGANTVSGVEFYTLPAISVLTSASPVRAYRPTFTDDGDGTVPVSSALMTASSTNVQRYWMNLFTHNRDFALSRSHRDLLEIPSVRGFIVDVLKDATTTLPSYITETQPAPLTRRKSLAFFLHSPLSIQLTNSNGDVTGLAEDGSITEGIPGSEYGELGDVKYIIAPQGEEYQLAMRGQDTGIFSLDMQELVGSSVAVSTTIANVPVTPATLANLAILDGITTASALSVDENGDGANVLRIIPRIGEVVSYEPPVLTEHKTMATSAGGGFSEAVASPSGTSQSTAITSPATTTRIASSTNVIIQPETRVKIIATPTRARVATSLAQTASVYTASQQPIIKQWGRAFYNGLQGFWHSLRRFFK